MKILKLCFLLFLGTFITNAQNSYTHALSGIKKIKIYTDTSVDVSRNSTHQLIINNAKASNEQKAHKKHNEEAHASRKKSREEKAKGLKPLYAKGNDNTGIGFEISKDGTTLIVKDLKSFMHRNGLQIKIPNGIALYLNCGNLGHATVTGITSEIEIKSNVGHITLTNITGPATVRTNTGNINATFATVSQSNPVSFSTATGDVDVSLSKNTKANLTLKTTMGTVYTDFDIAVEKSKGLSPIGQPRKIVTSLNNGGVQISLKSTTGNVYLRKK